MGNNIALKGMVENISVNGIDHRQHIHNVIVDQGLKTLMGMSSKAAISSLSPLIRPFYLMQSDLMYSTSSGVYYRAFPCLGCMFGSGNGATSVDQTSLESPIGEIDDLDSFGFHRSDLSYVPSFVVYNRYDTYEVHHMKYAWKATQSATIKEIGVYSFLMQDEQISSGFSKTESSSLSNFTNRRMFSRCVLNNPVEVARGDVVVVYYDVTLSVDPLPGAIVSTSECFGVPCVVYYANGNNVTANASSKTSQLINGAYSVINSDSLLSTIDGRLATPMLVSVAPIGHYENFSGVHPGMPCLCVSRTVVSGATRVTPFTSNTIGVLYGYSYVDNIQAMCMLGVLNPSATATSGISFSTGECTVSASDYSNTLHTLSKDFISQGLIDGTRTMVLLCGNYQFWLNSTVSEDNIVTQYPMTFPQNCSITFDVTTTLARG